PVLVVGGLAGVAGVRGVASRTLGPRPPRDVAHPVRAGRRQKIQKGELPSSYHPPCLARPRARGLPERRSATLEVFCFAYGRQSNYAAARGGGEHAGGPWHQVFHCLLMQGVGAGSGAVWGSIRRELSRNWYSSELRRKRANRYGCLIRRGLLSAPRSDSRAGCRNGMTPADGRRAGHGPVHRSGELHRVAPTGGRRAGTARAARASSAATGRRGGAWRPGGEVDRRRAEDTLGPF